LAEAPLEEKLSAWRRAAGAEWLQSIARNWPLLLLIILVVGAGLRFHGLDWDQPSGAAQPLQMHPDERALSFVGDRVDWPESIRGYFDTAQSPLNPYNAGTPSYVYGTFPLFLVKAVATLAGDDPAGPGNSYDATAIWGRRVTAAVDVATIAVVFALGAYLFGVRPGLLASGLYAFAVLPTQLAHFFTMDPYVTFFGALTLLLSAMLIRAEGRRDVTLLMAGLGLAVGLGLASKVTAWPLAIGPVFAIGIRIGLRSDRLGLRWRGERYRPGGDIAYDIAVLAMVGIIALMAFRVAQPYTFTGPNIWDVGINPQWRADIEGEVQRQSGDANFPPFVQFAGRTAFLTPLRNMVLFGLGPGLGVASWVALTAGAVLIFKRREMAFVLPVVIAAAIFSFQGPRFVAFMRYFLPMYPVLCVAAGWGLVAAWRAARTWEPARAPWPWRTVRWRPGTTAMRWASGTSIAVVLATTVFWATAFQNVYWSEHPRIQASQWIFDNLPPGTTITSEIWDDSLPYTLPGQEWGQYPIIELAPYDPDSPEKIRRLVYGAPGSTGSGLVNADYVSISSNRIRQSAPRLEREYPATTRYYELLDSGELGFELVQTFTVRPSFLGIRINDASAEESFTVYDHPEVRIYRKTETFDPERALRLLHEAHPERAFDMLPKQGTSNGLNFTEEQARVQQSGGTFTDVFSEDGWASNAPWFWWLAWIQLAAFATVPWATWLFRALPDRGYGLSKLLGIATVSLATWLLVAWGVADFSGGLVWRVFGAVVLAGLAGGVLRRAALQAEVRKHWHSWVALEAIFLVAFFAFLSLRLWNPDLWHYPQGGEKPMDLAYLTAVARSTQMPPYDPWFAGGTMNYYYMGWFVLAVPMRALRIVPEIAFNLGVPTFAALAATVAASTAHNLAGLATRMGQRLRDGRGWVAPVAVAVAGAVLLVGIGNLDGGHQTVERLQAVNDWGFLEGVPVLGGAVGIVGGLYQWLFQGADLPPFDWWRSSRVHFGSIDITEFPYWTFLFADLHPHLMGLPFFGAVIALSLAYIASTMRGLTRQAWVLAVALGLALGLVRMVHTWDLPAAVIIAAGGIGAGQWLRCGRWDLRWWQGVAHLVLVAVVLVVAFLPFTRHFEVFNSGVVRSPETTKPQQYFAQFGLFLAVAVAFVALRYHELYAERIWRHGPRAAAAVLRGRMELLLAMLLGTGLVAVAWILGYAVLAASAVVLVLLLHLAWRDFQSADPNIGRLMATLLLALAFAIAAGVDAVTVRNDIERMNTVFKFYMQAWQLFAVASAFAGWYVISALWYVRDRAPLPRPGREWAAVTVAVAGVLLLYASSIFVFAGTPVRQNARFADLSPTLDGLAYMEQAVYTDSRGREGALPVETRLADDEPLIRWLRKNVEGSPVIVEAVGPLYHWAGRISVNTGLPAVIGWDWHQTQQRWDYGRLVQERRSATQAFYVNPDTRAAELYLRKYNVSYVVVGTQEHAFGTPAGLAKFDSMAALTEVFRDGNYAIYRVDQSQIEPPL